MPTDPTGDIVLKIDMYISMEIATSSSPIKRVIANSKNEIGLAGKDILYGYGIKRPRAITGANLNAPLASRFDSSFTYHV
jgi:hypothetical protein